MDKYTTVSLEVATKMKETGWTICTTFNYIADCIMNGVVENYTLRNDSWDNLDIAAPQLHEILEELPYLPYTSSTADPLASKNVTIIRVGHEYIASIEKTEIAFVSKNPHDAAGMLWVWYVENGYFLNSKKE